MLFYGFTEKKNIKNIISRKISKDFDIAQMRKWAKKGEWNMYIKIFQKMPERSSLDFNDFNEMWGIQNVSDVNAELYQNVFSGDVDCEDLEDVYRKFNHEMHPLFRGKNMGLTDVVIFEGEAYFCQNEGFSKVEFDVSKTYEQDNLIKIVYVEPNRKPFVSEILNELEAEQKAVGGLIELIGNGDGTYLVGNDESKLLGMEGNRILDSGAVIAGPFFVVGDEGENFRSLTEDEIKKYMDMFYEPEEISRQQVEADMGFLIFSF